MGAAQYDGRPSPVFAARLDHAVSLYFAGVASKLVMTGGKAEGDRTTEAAAGRDFAIALGVPPDAILVEEQSRTTLESVRAVASLLAANDLHNAVFVSDRPHMLRVLRMADDEGVTAWGSPTQTSPIEGDLGRPGGRHDPRAGGARLLLRDGRIHLARGGGSSRRRKPDRHARRTRFPSWR